MDRQRQVAFAGGNVAVHNIETIDSRPDKILVIMAMLAPYPCTAYSHASVGTQDECPSAMRRCVIHGLSHP